MPPTLVGGDPERFVGAIDVDADHLRAVAGEHLGDGGADAAGGAGHDGDLAVEGLVPVGGRRRIGRTDAEHLPVDVGRLAGQDETQGRLEAGRRRLGVGGEVHQRHRCAATHLLGQRAGEALEGALRDLLVRAARLVRRGTDHDDATRRPEVAQQRREELVEALQPDGFGDAGGVEHQPAERVGPASAEVVGHQFVVVGERDAQRFDDAALTADEQGACQRRITGPIAAQRLGLRDAELLGQEVSWRRVNELRVQVGSHGDELTPE